jgi:copper chaperone CopZ
MRRIWLGKEYANLYDERESSLMMAKQTILVPVVIAVLFALAPGAAAESAGAGLADLTGPTDLKEPEGHASPQESTSTSAEPAESAVGSQEILPERLFRARLSGSLCASCLKHLQVKLNEVKGVKRASVFRAEKPANARTEPRYAHVEVLYSPDLLNRQRIRKIIERSDFAVRKEHDEEVRSRPLSSVGDRKDSPMA